MKDSMKESVTEIKRAVKDPFVGSTPYRAVAHLSREWGWVLAAGIVLAAIGFFALVMPVAATIGMTYGLAIALIATGIVALLQAIRMRKMMRVGSLVFQAVVSIVAGAIMLRYIGAGMIGITLCLAFYLFAVSVGRWMLAMDLKPYRGSGWMTVNSVISFVLGVMLIATLPESAVFAPGVFLGVDLIFSGMMLMGLAIALRNAHKKDEPTVVAAEDARRAA